MDGQVPSKFLVGTSSWSSRDWCGSFYPESIDSGEMIRVYADKFPTVEVDATWYRIPDANMVDAWDRKTPDGFVFSAKVPRVITHDKYLEDCETELNEFVAVMSRLGDKLGPLLLQFPYFAKGRDPDEYETGADFIERIGRFSLSLPRELQWVVEIRNSKWIRPALLEVLRKCDISLAFIDYYTMDPLYKLANLEGIFTAPFVYIRFLGNRKQIEATVKKARSEGKRSRDWESLIVDRTEQMKRWIPSLKDLAQKSVPAYVYFNNHYAGYAPGSVELLMRLFKQ
ncbi:MAG: DUF72 domain-containing protein [Acidobacteriota bacterium]